MSDEQQDQGGRWQQQGGWTPSPDPTQRTNEQLEQKIQHIRELLAKDKEVIQTKIGEMEKAVVLLQSNANRSPTLDVIDANVKRLEDVTNERFIGVAQKIEDLIATIAQASVKDAKAVDAAFSAQKESVAEQNKSNALAIAKSEAAFTKQIDSIHSIVQQQYKSLDEKIEDTKARQSLTEGHKKGVETSYGIVVGLGMMGLAIAGLAVAIAGLYMK